MNSDLNSFPNTPGIYLFRDKEKKIIYVGKAANLKKRVSSYFSGRFANLKMVKLVAEIKKIDFIKAPSEIEALILESEFIKRYKPKYNILGRDDKSFLYLAIPKEDFSIPYLLRLPREMKQNRVDYFGPFTNGKSLRKSLKFLRKIFPYANKSCLKAKKPCFYFQLRQCPGVCNEQISAKEYQKNIKGLVDFFSGKTAKIKKWMIDEMKQAAKEKEFEKAAMIRDRMKNLGKISSISILEDSFGTEDKALFELQQYLKLKSLPKRIEIFDISNMAGKFACGSMAVYIGSLPKASLYRKFKIKTVKQINDYDMMKEVLRRRFSSKSGRSFEELPDVVIVDGGKGHLTASREVLKDLEKDIPLFSLAKRNEELFGVLRDKNFNTDAIKKIEIPRNSECFYLLQRMRDEAHRFAISYFRNLKKKGDKSSVLDEITGIGPQSKKKLLSSFKSIDGIKKASLKDLENVVGKKMALIVKKHIS